MSTAPAQPLNPEAPLPQDWQRTTDSSGSQCFTNPLLNLLTYYDPRLPFPHSSGFVPASLSGPPLPSGWEAITAPNEPLTFLDHNTHTSTTLDPRSPHAQEPLPEGWEISKDDEGERCWKNEQEGLRTYYDPREPDRYGDGFVAAKVDEINGKQLPSRWEAVRKPGGPLVFLDHNKHCVTSLDPRL